MLDQDNFVLYFMFIKNVQVIEVYSFDYFFGKLFDLGILIIEVFLDLVNINIFICNICMQEMLFEVVKYFIVIFSVILLLVLLDMVVGISKVSVVEGELSLYGMIVLVSFNVMVSKLFDDMIQVLMILFILIGVDIFGLKGGVEVL